MGVPMMIQPKDSERISHLQKTLGMHKKIDVLRAGLDLLEKEALRLHRIQRWKHAVKLISKTSHEVNEDFQLHSLIKLK
ncbi:MAG: hypothetical protein A3F43_06335 [Gammaproteobacteria bacterium RIFCSPHIGHO2_12_FULL_42_10]|nr:MAG: hypothetical protein A3F43_06335 [Gammaproteobacteria bacterium RIFCSPHIGHO2_12_FULL_42_10]